MVDFNKLRKDHQQRERDAQRTTTTDPHSRAQVHRNLKHGRRSAQPSWQRADIGEGINREMRDPDYLDSLVEYRDSHA